MAACLYPQVPAFRSLPQLEQIQLLKGASIELLILRSVLTFDPDKQQFLDITDKPDVHAMNVDQLRNAEIGTGLFEAHMAFVRSFAIDLRADETTLVLLLVISLFSPDRATEEGKKWSCQFYYNFMHANLNMYLKDFIDFVICWTYGYGRCPDLQ